MSTTFMNYSNSSFMIIFSLNLNEKLISRRNKFEGKTWIAVSSEHVNLDNSKSGK